jgi:hypothetical protein
MSTPGMEEGSSQQIFGPLPGALQVGLCHSSVVDATQFFVMLHCSSRTGMYSDQRVPTTDCCLSSC